MINRCSRLLTACAPWQTQRILGLYSMCHGDFAALRKLSPLSTTSQHAQDLWPWPSNSSERWSMPIPVPIFQVRTSIGLAVKVLTIWQTHTQTHKWDRFCYLHISISYYTLISLPEISSSRFLTFPCRLTIAIDAPSPPASLPPSIATPKQKVEIPYSAVWFLQKMTRSHFESSWESEIWKHSK